MQRVDIDPTTLLINVQEVYDMIEQDLVSNSNEVIHRFDYYTHKYRGDLLNDVNVGIFINDNLKIVVQIYVTNGIDIIKTQLIYSNDGRRISAIDEIINTFKNNIMKIKVPVYTKENNLSLEDRIHIEVETLLSVTDFKDLDIVDRTIEGENIVLTLKGIR